MIKPLFTLIAAVAVVALFGHDTLRYGVLNLLFMPAAAPIVQEFQDPADSARVFRQALGGATDQAGGLLDLGERKSRNIPEILSEQRKLGARLAEIDALIASGTLPQEMQPAIDAYTSGAADIRGAMQNAKSGFSQLNWEKVRGATEQLAKGVASLAEARRLSGG